MTQKRLTKEERKKQILEAAQMVFIKYGYNGTTTIEIAKAADISEVTLFRNFASKQEIFLEIIEPVLMNTLKQTIQTSKNYSPKEKIECILSERIIMISKNYEIIRLILMEKNLLDELGMEDFIDKFRMMFVDVFNELKLPKHKLEFIIRLIMGSILSFLFKPEQDEEYIKSYVCQIINLMMNVIEGEK